MQSGDGAGPPLWLLRRPRELVKEILNSLVLVALTVVKRDRTPGNHNVPNHHRLGESGTAEIQKVTTASRAPDKVIANKKCSDTNDTSRGTRTCTCTAAATAVNDWRWRQNWG